MKQATLAPSSTLPPVAEKACLRVVAMGGGTGLSTLLRGFKHYVPSPGATQPKCDGYPCLISHLAAIVTVTDDGGSSGRLRKDFNMLPPGDLRNCMVALSEDEHLIARLFRHRFRAGGELEGHSFGNLFVAGRLSNQIYGYSSATGVNPPSPFVPFSTNPIFSKLPDQPEFLLWVPDQS